MFLGQTPKEGSRNFGENAPNSFHSFGMRAPIYLNGVWGVPSRLFKGFGVNTSIFWNVLGWALQFFETDFGVIPQDFIQGVVGWTPQNFFIFGSGPPILWKYFGWTNPPKKTKQMKFDETWWNLMKLDENHGFIKFHQIWSSFIKFHWPNFFIEKIGWEQLTLIKGGISFLPFLHFGSNLLGKLQPAIPFWEDWWSSMGPKKGDEKYHQEPSLEKRERWAKCSLVKR